MLSFCPHSVLFSCNNTKVDHAFLFSDKMFFLSWFPMLSYNRPHWTQTCECLQWFCLALFIVLIIRNCLVVYCWKKPSTSLVFFFLYSKLCTKWFAVGLCLTSVGRYWCMLPFIHPHTHIWVCVRVFIISIDDICTKVLGNVSFWPIYH